MYRIIYIQILLLCLLFSFIFIPSVSYSQQWNYIAIAHLNEDTNFYLFLDYSKSNKDDTLIQFREKHSFNTAQSLPSGSKYMTVEITRVINCKDLLIADKDAYFRDDDGSVVEHYSSNGENRFKEINIQNDVNYEVFKKICK